MKNNLSIRLKKNIPDFYKLLFILIIFFLILFPFGIMLSKIRPDDFKEVANSPLLVKAILNSLFTSAITVVLSVGLSLLLALALQRSNVKFKNFFSVFLSIPMLVPSICLGSGLVALFGNNGIFTKFFHTSTNIYGYLGIILGSFLYSFPVAFLMINDVLRYEDAQVYEAADALGVSKIRQFFDITLPYLKNPLILASISVFTMVITDYGIPAYLNGKTTTIAYLLYQQIHGHFNFGTGTVYGLFLLIPAIVSFIYNIFFRDIKKNSFVSKAFEIKKNIWRDLFSYLYLGIFTVFVLLLIYSFFIFTFAEKYPTNMSLSFVHITSTFVSNNAGKNLANSLMIALFSAIFGSILTYISGYLVVRIKSKISGILHFFSILSSAIPGLVLGLAYILTYKNFNIYGTIFILVMVNVAHFFASPYLMVRNSLSKINENIESVGETLGISRISIIFKVIIPQSFGTLIETFTYYFVNCMMTISAVSFLYTYETKPLSMMIGQFQEQMDFQNAAVIAITILLINLLVKIISNLIKGTINRKRGS